MATLRRGYAIALVAFILWITPAAASAQSVTLAWDPSEGASGYTVLWGTAPGAYTNSANAGNSTELTIGGLAAGATYWAVVQAYNGSGTSPYSTMLQFTIPGAACTYSINPASISIGAAQASGTMFVTTQTGCAWTASSGNNFITFQNATGRSGSGPLGFTILANTSTSGRTGTATVAGQSFGVTQQGTVTGTTTPPDDCSYSISPSTVSISSASATGTILVTTQSGCTWSASSTSGFITFANGTGRSGGGTVNFTVSANTGTSLRTGSATVAGKTFTVSQVGAAQACTYAISPASISISSAEASGTMFVTTQAGCTWSAPATSGFMSFQNGSGRIGSGSLNFTVAANTSTSSRTGTATVATKTFAVTQAGAAPPPACTYTITPTNVSISSASASGNIFVTTQTGCAWSATSSSDFITFQNGTGRTGTGQVGFTVAENTTTEIRTGSATVATQAFSVSQMGVAADAPGGSTGNWSADFDGDGKNDLLVHDQVGGNVEAWLLDGTTVKGRQSFSHRVLDPNWMMVGRGDFNGDGKTDLVWQHKTDGSVYVWFMDGTVRVGGSYTSTPRVLDVAWRVRGIGDFNGDGRPDLLWQHPVTGALATWLLNGTNVVGVLSLIPDRTLDLKWQVDGVADFNGDGKSDLLWRNRGTGEVGVWYMNGVSRIIYSPLTPGFVADQHWQIAAITDANGDGKPDIVWQHTDGWIAVWYMNGAARAANPSISESVPNGWRIVGPK